MNSHARSQVGFRPGHRPDQCRRPRRGRGAMPRGARALSARREHAGAARRPPRQDGSHGRGGDDAARGDRRRADLREAARGPGPPAGPGEPARRCPAVPRARDAARSVARARLVHARQGARAAPARAGGRRGIREVLRAVAGTAPDGARRGAPERGPPRGGRAPLSPGAAPEPAQRRRDAPARADRDQGGPRRRRREPARAGDRDRAGFPCWRYSTWAGSARSRTATARRSNASTARSRSMPSQPQAHYLRASTLARASFTQEAIEAYPRVPEAAAQPHRRAARPRSRAEGRRRLRRRRRVPTTTASGTRRTSAKPTGASPISRPTASTTRRSPRWNGAPPPQAQTCSRK